MDSKDSQAVDTVDLAAIIRPLLARWKLILVLALAGAAAGFVISSLQPKVFQSRATIFAKQPRNGMSLLGSLPSALGGAGGTPSGYFTALLQSDTMLISVINRLGLTHIPEFTRGRKLNMEKALRLLNRSVTVQSDRSGAVDILTRSTSPQLAARIGNTMLDCLSDMVVTTSKRKVTFISGKLEDTVRDLHQAEEEMRRFQETHDVAAIEEQTKSLVEELASVEARLLALDVESEELASRLSNAGELDTLVDDEVRKRAVDSSRNLVLRKRAELREKLARLPEVAANYAGLQRKIAALNKTFEILTEQYQLERITQQGEDGDYQIIDRARPDTQKISPRRAVSTAVGGLLGFALASMMVSFFAPARTRKKGY